MRSHQKLSIFLILIGSLVNAANIPIRRQDATTAATSVSDTQVSTHPTALITSTVAPATELPSTVSTTMIDIHTEISGTFPTSVSSPSNAGNGTFNGNELPIQPVISPAVAIAGVVLIITGIAYNLIGIKNLWIHVFLSAAYLTSLSITVLIEYVMSPPVSNGVQGAYFVAIFCTGLIFGGLSLIFKELTEGLGCLLGGFCLSMWLLSLKDGGLVSSPSSKGAFIGAFCVVVYILSFSSYTRPYALIVSTAFAGSTAAILGVDCFSRAGLKEFWLYNWGLNDNIFPLNTTTYPLNRGIRVELAAIIVVCLLGLLSQFRLWKAIRERRQRQEAMLAEEERKKDENEIELGRTLEERKMHELARWEAVYGDHSKRGSTEAETLVSGIHRNHSAPDIPQKDPGVPVEMVAMSIPGYNIASPPEKNDGEGENAQDETGTINEETVTADEDELPHSEMPQADENVDTVDEYNDVNETPAGGSVRPPTPFLFIQSSPFNIPSPEERKNNDDDHSIQAIIDDGDSAANRLSRRLSAVTLFRRLSQRNSTSRNSHHITSDSEEMLVPTSPSPASSVQGIADIDYNAALEDQDTVPQAEPETNLDVNTISKDTNPKPASGIDNENGTPKELCTAQSRPDQPEIQTKNTATKAGDDRQTDVIKTEGLRLSSLKRRHTFDGVASALATSLAVTRASAADSPLSMTDSVPEKAIPVQRNPEVALLSSQSRSSVGKKESLTAGAVEDLPSHVSPLITSYRTNEWAKHLADADTPDLEAIEVSPQNSNSCEEETAPVKVDELTQTATTAVPPTVREKRVSLPEKLVDNTVYRTSLNASKQSTRETVPRWSPSIYVDNTATHMTNAVSAKAASNPDLLLLNSNRSPPFNGTQGGGPRNSSTSFLSTSLAAAPIDESQVVNFDSRPSEGSLPLLAQREKMVQSRLSSLSLTRDSWIARSPSRQSVNGHQSRPNSQLSLVEDDDMPLTQRRALLQQRATSPVSVNADAGRRSAVVDVYPVTARLSRESKGSSKSKSVTMAAWRESLQEELSRSQSPLADVDVARKEMMEQQRRAQIAKHKRVMASESLDNSIAERMRRGEMQDIHREAMRRMQAAANRKAKDNNT